MRPLCLMSPIAALSLAATLTAPASAAEPGLIGRWNLIIGEPEGYPAWMRVSQRDGRPAVSFLNGSGSPGDGQQVRLEGSELVFEGWDRTWRCTLDGPDAIRGRAVSKDGNSQPFKGVRFVPRRCAGGTWDLVMPSGDKVVVEITQQGDDLAGTLRSDGRRQDLQELALDAESGVLSFKVGPQTFSGRLRGDDFEGTVSRPDGQVEGRVEGKRRREWAEPVELFNGRNLDGWKPMTDDPARNHWKVIDGILENTAMHGANIVHEKAFGDFRLHVEFRVPPGGNSGVYLRGRHEIQVADTFGHDLSVHMGGALYGRVPPAVNAARPAGEWQTYDITLIDRCLTVVHNGRTIHDRIEIEGVTGGMIDGRENDPGAIYLQGDHTQVSYRKITLTPARPTCR